MYWELRKFSFRFFRRLSRSNLVSFISKIWVPVNPFDSTEEIALTTQAPVEIMNTTLDESVITEPVFSGNIWEEEGVSLAIRNALVNYIIYRERSLGG